MTATPAQDRGVGAAVLPLPALWVFKAQRRVGSLGQLRKARSSDANARTSRKAPDAVTPGKSYRFATSRRWKAGNHTRDPDTAYDGPALGPRRFRQGASHALSSSCLAGTRGTGAAPESEVLCPALLPTPRPGRPGWDAPAPSSAGSSRRGDAPAEPQTGSAVGKEPAPS